MRRRTIGGQGDSFFLKANGGEETVVIEVPVNARECAFGHAGGSVGAETLEEGPTFVGLDLYPPIAFAERCARRTEMPVSPALIRITTGYILASHFVSTTVRASNGMSSSELNAAPGRDFDTMNVQSTSQRSDTLSPRSST